MEHRYYAVVEGNRVRFTATNAEEVPENWRELSPGQYKRFTDDPEKTRHYVLKNDKIVYEKPKDEPPDTPTGPSLAERIDDLDKRLSALEKKAK